MTLCGAVQVLPPGSRAWTAFATQRLSVAMQCSAAQEVARWPRRSVYRWRSDKVAQF